MTSTQVLSDFASALASGAVEVVDLTAPLGPETPLIKLPPQIGANTPPIEIHAISNYDKTGPYLGLELAEARRAFRHPFRRARSIGSAAAITRTAAPTPSR